MSYINRHDLNRHRRNVHWANPALEKKEMNKRGHQCELCPATYKDRSNLNKHIRREHDGESAVARRERMEGEAKTGVTPPTRAQLQVQFPPVLSRESCRVSRPPSAGTPAPSSRKKAAFGGQCRRKRGWVVDALLE